MQLPLMDKVVGSKKGDTMDDAGWVGGWGGGLCILGMKAQGSKGLTDPKPPAAQAKSALKMSPVSK